jgi:hypothetical protein
MLDRCPHLRLAIAALFAAIAGISMGTVEASQQSLELILPREPAHDEAVWLQVRVGALPPRASIRVDSSEGELLGSVSPYGSVRGAPSATYLVPLPKTAVVDGRLQLRLTVEEPGKPSRAPRANEIDTVVPVYVPITN